MVYPIEKILKIVASFSRFPGPSPLTLPPLPSPQEKKKKAKIT